MTLIDFTPLDNETIGQMLTALLLNEAARLAALDPATHGCDDCQRRIGQPHTPTCPSDGRVTLADTLAGKGAGQRWGNRDVPAMIRQVEDLRQAIRAEGTPAVQDAWDANPWVAAITFTVQNGNIDGATHA